MGTIPKIHPIIFLGVFSNALLEIWKYQISFIEIPWFMMECSNPSSIELVGIQRFHLSHYVNQTRKWNLVKGINQSNSIRFHRILRTKHYLWLNGCLVCGILWNLVELEWQIDLTKFLSDARFTEWTWWNPLNSI